MDQPHRVHLRLLVSPSFEVREIDVRRYLPPSASLPVSIMDNDVNVTVVACAAGREDLVAAAEALMRVIEPDGALGRSLRCDVQPQTDAPGLDEDSVRSLAIAAHGALSCPVFVGRRIAPMSAWRSLRPMTWGRRGLEVAGGAQPVLPFGGSKSEGIAVEVGPPTLIYKARLSGIRMEDAQRIASAVGGGTAGLVGVAAYAIDGAEPGAACVLCETESDADVFLRLLSLVELEARRYGGIPGAGAFLSAVPLSVITGVLKTAMGLPLERRQIIETHLTALGGA